MKRFLIAGLACLLLALLSLFSACSDTVTNSLPAGDPADADFQFVEDEVSDQVFDGVDLSLQFSTELVDSIPGAAPLRPGMHVNAATYSALVFDSLSYSFTNDWHLFDFWGFAVSESLLDTVDVSGIDSIQILASGVPLQVPDESIDQISFRAHFSAANRAGTATRDGVHRIDISRTDPLTEVTNIDGSAQEAISFVHTDTSGSCDIDVNVDFSANDVVIDFAGNDCPQSGSVSIALALSADCTGGGLTLSIDGNWSVMGTYNGDIGNFTYSDGQNVWSGVDSCDTGGPQGIARLR
jgi:hypothetical protein